MQRLIINSLTTLFNFCVQRDFRGDDPFDGLSSPYFQRLPLHHTKWMRIAWLQLVKRCPVNIRPLLAIKPLDNPKALALSVSALLLLKKSGYVSITDQMLFSLYERMMGLRTSGYHGDAWGYPFDWQSRAFFVPAGTPNIIVSTFVGHALLDLYAHFPDEKYKQHACSIAEFIGEDLNRTTDKKGNICFSYTPLDFSQIYNATLLGARLLSRLYHITNSDVYYHNARSAVTFCIHRQAKDGSWSYGSAQNQQWIDSFHTGYNLEALWDYMEYTGDREYSEHFERGFSYYIKTFFTGEGVPRYYSHKTYPIDVHATAQLIITLCRTKKLKSYREIAEKVLDWTIKALQAPNGGFYFQKNQWYINKTIYLRWSCAWMLLALSHFLCYEKKHTV